MISFLLILFGRDRKDVCQERKVMIANFLASLKVMGLGMIGVFSVTLILMVIMVALNKAFPPKKKEDSAEDDD